MGFYREELFTLKAERYIIELEDGGFAYFDQLSDYTVNIYSGDFYRATPFTKEEVEYTFNAITDENKTFWKYETSSRPKVIRRITYVLE